MDPAKRIITSLPLEELWNAAGPVSAERIRYLDRVAIADLLRLGGARFLVAHLGAAPEWVAPDQTFAVWRELREKVVAPDSRPENDGELRYWASEWADEGSGPLVVFESFH
jgi:hypothetical protein